MGQCPDGWEWRHHTYVRTPEATADKVGYFLVSHLSPLTQNPALWTWRRPPGNLSCAHPTLWQPPLLWRTSRSQWSVFPLCSVVAAEILIGRHAPRRRIGSCRRIQLRRGCHQGRGVRAGPADGRGYIRGFEKLGELRRLAVCIVHRAKSRLTGLVRHKSCLGRGTRPTGYPTSLHGQQPRQHGVAPVACLQEHAEAKQSSQLGRCA